jgi:hypothetical protein
LSKDCCSGFSHFDGATITFHLREESAKEFSSATEASVYAMTESMDETSRSFVRSTIEFAIENKKIRELSQSVRNESRSCYKCGGTGKISCSNCGGSGYIDCSDCSGKGGFESVLQIKEKRKNIEKEQGILLDVKTDGGFWKNCWSWSSDPDKVRMFDGTNIICSKTRAVSASDNARKIQNQVLGVSILDGDFHFPEGLSEEAKEKLIASHLDVFGEYINKCKEIEQEASGWGDSYRIKEASLKITETPCFVQVEFSDRLGFMRTALVNLASEKVYLNAVSEEERNRRLPELEREAASDPNLQNIIGQMYGDYPMYKGYTSKDVELSASWFMRAAKAGHADAMDNLGNCYKSGNGVEKDEELAAAWYAKAAKAGHPWGQYHYADVLEDGKGVPKDDELAVAWYLKAAKQGLANAQWRLGCRIADGRGTAKDEELGEAWKERAKANGFVPPRSSGW